MLSNLPTDCLFEICTHLEYDDLVNLISTCSTLNSKISIAAINKYQKQRTRFRDNEFQPKINYIDEYFRDQIFDFGPRSYYPAIGFANCYDNITRVLILSASQNNYTQFMKELKYLPFSHSRINVVEYVFFYSKCTDLKLLNFMIDYADISGSLLHYHVANRWISQGHKYKDHPEVVEFLKTKFKNSMLDGVFDHVFSVDPKYDQYMDYGF